MRDFSVLDKKYPYYVRKKSINAGKRKYSLSAAQLIGNFAKPLLRKNTFCELVEQAVKSVSLFDD